MTCHVCVVVHTPAHSQVSGPLTYGSVQPLAPGTLVRVPLGKRETLGVVWDTDPHAPPPPDSMDVKPVASVLDHFAGGVVEHQHRGRGGEGRALVHRAFGH